MEKLSFNVETYEGPLDLLLSLIKKNEMSIFDIQIHIIFKQYMEYLAVSATYSSRHEASEMLVPCQNP